MADAMQRHMDPHAAEIAKLRAALEELGNQGMADAVQRHMDPHAAEIAKLRAALEELSNQGMADAVQRHLDPHAAEIAKLRAALEELSNQGMADAVQRHMDPHAAEITRIRAALNELTNQGMADAMQRHMDPHVADIAQLRAALDELSNQGNNKAIQMELGLQSVEIGKLRNALIELSIRGPPPVQGGAESQEDNDELINLVLTSGQECAEEVRKLNLRCNEIQDVFERRFSASVLQYEKLLPDMSNKVDRLLVECAERFQKVEEHNVRLNFTLTRLDAQEQRVQSCFDHVEAMPSLSKLRSLCREELHKHFERADIELLSQRVSVQANTLDVLGDRFQDVCDQLLYRGFLPALDDEPRKLVEGIDEDHDE